MWVNQFTALQVSKYLKILKQSLPRWFRVNSWEIQYPIAKWEQSQTIAWQTIRIPHTMTFLSIFRVQFLIIVYNSTAILLVIISLINKIYRPDAIMLQNRIWVETILLVSIIVFLQWQGITFLSLLYLTH